MKRKQKKEKEKLTGGEIFGLIAFSFSAIAIIFVIAMVILFIFHYISLIEITWSNYYLILGVISAVGFLTLILFSIKLLMDKHG
jgi:hypothetical protein